MSITEISKTITEEISVKVTEDYEKFVFETISPFCNGVMKMKISKDDLEKALKQYFSNKRSADDDNT